MKRRLVLLSSSTFVAGYFLAYLIYAPHQRSVIDGQWHTEFSEDQVHQRIMELENALPKAKTAKDAEELSKILDAQLRIEDLVIKSREAEYAKWLPFTPLFAGGAGAVLGFFTGLLGRKPDREG